MNRPTRRQPGFTLVEVMIALAILALLMTAAALAIQAAHSAYAYNTEKTELVMRARGVLDRISLDLRRAIEFNVLDDHSLDITMPDGMIHTYAWDSTARTVRYSETDPGGLVTGPATLTPFAREFTVCDLSPTCYVRLVLEGSLAASEASITAIPRKALF